MATAGEMTARVADDMGLPAQYCGVLVSEAMNRAAWRELESELDSMMDIADDEGD